MEDLKKTVYKNKPLRSVVLPVYNGMRRSRHFSSRLYWENRYKKGGNSGAGSYGRLAKFKAEFLNDFAKKNSIATVIEFGSGDGNQLSLFKFKDYIGLDVSKVCIGICREKYARDKHKSFYLYDPLYFVDNRKLFAADLALSLDVVYHLVEDEVFEKYMHDLFSASKKYVIIYASNTDYNPRGQAQHVRHRKFTDWVAANAKKWKLDKVVENKHKLKTNEIDQSFADFYIFKKKST